MNQPEQNKTAEEILRKHVEQESIRRGDGTISDEDWAYGDEDGVMQIAINAMEEYASQQTASLQRQVEEREREVDALRKVIKDDKRIHANEVKCHIKTSSRLDLSSADARQANDRIKSLESEVERLRGILNDIAGEIASSNSNEHTRYNFADALSNIDGMVNKALNPQDKQK